LINDIKKRYKFLSDKDSKLLYLLVKSGIKYDVVKNLRSKQINEYVKRHVNELKKINKDSLIDKEGLVCDIDVNTLFLLKKRKLTLRNIRKKLNEVNSLNVTYYPDSKPLVKKAKKRVFISSLVNLTIMIICALVLLTNSFNLFNWNKENNKIKKISAKVNKEVVVKEEKVNKEDFVIDDYFKYKDVSIMDVDFK